jgi:hypothetical protein
MIKYLAVIVSALLVFGCSAHSPTPYQPDAHEGGFSEIQLTTDTYKVLFKGNALTDKAAVDEYALLRCAELTLEKECSYFTITKNEQFNFTETVHIPGIGLGMIIPMANELMIPASGTPSYDQQLVRPRSMKVIKVHKEKPTTGFAYNAILVSESIKGRYKLKSVAH